MEIEHVHNRDIRYTLTNEGLKIGDRVYPIARGRTREDGVWILHDLNYEDHMCGLPDEPHTIVKFTKNKSEQYRTVVTNMGYSPEPCYYKVIKRERQVSDGREMFPMYKWVEIDKEK